MATAIIITPEERTQWREQHETYENMDTSVDRKITRLLDALEVAEARTERAIELAKRAIDSMSIHNARCPMHPFTNYSGMEEHCAEYRQVYIDGKRLFELFGV